MREYVAILCYSLVMIFAFAWISILILAMTGCSTKTTTEYKDVLVPIPQVCDLNISTPPQINTSDLQNTLKTLKDLSYDSVTLRKILSVTPCVKINYKD